MFLALNLIFFCRDWGEIVRSPRYWAGAAIKISEKNAQEMVTLKSERVNIVGEVNLDDNNWTIFANRLFLEFFVENTDLVMKCLKANKVILRTLDPDILSKTICRAEEVEMSMNMLTISQLNSMFIEITNCKDLKLTKLNLDFNNIEDAVPETLSSAVSRLTEVSLGCTFPTIDQLNILLDDISKSKKENLKMLDLGSSDLSDIPTDMLTKAMGRLEKFDLSDAHLTTTQLNALFIYLSQASDVKLQTLNLSMNDLSGIAPEFLPTAVCKLEKVDLSDTQLTTNHLNFLFSEISECTMLTLKKLDVGENFLSKLNEDTLASAVCRLEEVHLNLTHITTNQINAIFEKISKWSQSKLKIITLKNNNLSDVHKDDLENAVSKLEKAGLLEDDLNYEQILIFCNAPDLYNKIQNCNFW